MTSYTVYVSFKVTAGNAEGEERFSAILIGQIIAFLIGLPTVITSHPGFAAGPVVCIIILGVFQLGIPYILFASHPVFTSGAVIRIIILGVFQLGISYILYIKSSKYCPPLACCLLGAVEPLLNPVWVFLFDGEKPGLYALIGAVIVVASVTLWCALGNKSKEETHA